MTYRSVIITGLLACSIISSAKADLNTYACPLKFEGEQLSTLKKKGALTVKDPLTGDQYTLRSIEGDLDIPSTPLRRKLMAKTIQLEEPSASKHEDKVTLVKCRYTYEGLRSSLGMGKKSFTLIFENR
ncbi:MAG TPA: hypothetical protein VNJ29_00075 [Candidatus Nitrosotenuis sp.]|jgi:hypothetical protein|nr:hypothetical protein [Candidatus Nitrosotenuis sp.]